jgi:phospholipase C
MARKRIASLVVAALAVGAVTVGVAQAASAGARHRTHSRHTAFYGNDGATSTPIKHLVVIFQENVSFDHYFGTYPNATNTDGSPFHASPRTPSVNGLAGNLLTNNPNGANPSRLSHAQALTCDQGHGYTAEQKAYDMGLMDKFIPFTDVESCSPPDQGAPHLVLDYYDGNTVTGLWNYAQHFAMSDNSYSTVFGPSTPGAINVTGANTFGAICGGNLNATPCAAPPGTTPATPGHPQAQGPGTITGDPDPNLDVCSATQDHAAAASTAEMGGKNIGDLLNQDGVS